MPNLGTSNFTLKLPAAEEDMVFPKEKVIGLRNEEDPPPAYVVFPTKVKKVFGLQLPENIWSTDYFTDFADDRRQFVKNVKKVNSNTAANVSSAVQKDNQLLKFNILQIFIKFTKHTP